MKTVWIDLETTGLDPAKGHILEVGWAVVENPYDDLSKVITSRTALFCQRHQPCEVDPFVLAMHTSNNLWWECNALAMSLPLGHIESLLLSALPGPDRSYTLAGSSVHFDLAWLRVHMPRVAAKFSHRLLDVSAVYLFAKGIGMPEIEKTGAAHRVTGDIIDSQRYLRHCRDWLISNAGLAA